MTESIRYRQRQTHAYDAQFHYNTSKQRFYGLLCTDGCPRPPPPSGHGTLAGATNGQSHSRPPCGVLHAGGFRELRPNRPRDTGPEGTTREAAESGTRCDQVRPWRRAAGASQRGRAADAARAGAERFFGPLTNTTSQTVREGGRDSPLQRSGGRAEPASRSGPRRSPAGRARRSRPDLELIERPRGAEAKRDPGRAALGRPSDDCPADRRGTSTACKRAPGRTHSGDVNSERIDAGTP